jgi:hypothetical protein
VVEGLGSVEEDGDNSVRNSSLAIFFVHSDLKLSVHLLSVDSVLGGRLNLHLVRSVVDGFLFSVGGPDDTFIKTHVHLVTINGQNLGRHISETGPSQLEVSVSGGGVSGDDVNGGLSHSGLAEAGPLILLSEVGDRPVGLLGFVAITDSSSGCDEHGRDK